MGRTKSTGTQSLSSKMGKMGSKRKETLKIHMTHSWETCNKRMEEKMTAGMHSTTTNTNINLKERNLKLNLNFFYLPGALTALPSRRRCCTHPALMLSRRHSTQWRRSFKPTMRVRYRSRLLRKF